jgi:pantoate--beta-alanine ligase
MKVFKTVDSLRKWRSDLSEEKTLGLVPTMGALHEGHLSLIRRSSDENDLCLATIFVNPTQFDRKEDLESYPNSLETDLQMLKESGCDVVFVPTSEDIYENKIASDSFDFDGLDKVMEGRYRKGHFDGVATIVRKIFRLTDPDRAYFGEKDFQQLQIIRKMVREEKLSVEIVPCEIYREEDGLAMSSRNRRLDAQQRKEASLLYRTLEQSRELLKKGAGFEIIHKMADEAFQSNPLLKLEYFEIAEIDTLATALIYDPSKKYRAFIAAFAGPVRLIDNIALN